MTVETQLEIYGLTERFPTPKDRSRPFMWAWAVFLFLVAVGYVGLAAYLDSLVYISNMLYGPFVE